MNDARSVQSRTLERSEFLRVGAATGKAQSIQVLCWAFIKVSLKQKLPSAAREQRDRISQQHAVTQAFLPLPKFRREVLE